MNVEHSAAVPAKLYLPADAADQESWDTHTQESATVMEAVQRRAADAAGGFTVYDAKGGWSDDNGNLVYEQTHVVAATFDNPAEAREWAEDMGKFVAQATNESIVMAEVAGEMIQVS